MNNGVSFDAMIKMAAMESVYRQLDEFPSKKELEEMFTTSDAHENKMNKLIKKESRYDRLVAFNRQFSKVAVVLLVVFTVTFTPLISAKAVRESIVETIIEWRDEFASIFFKSENEPAVINDVKIGYMVDGFESEGELFKNDHSYKNFYYRDNQHITVEISSKNIVATYIDNECSDYYIIIIDGYDGILVYQDNRSSLRISDDKYTYFIDGNIDIGEIINIYKNIEFF